MMVLSTPIFLSPLSHDLFNNQPGGASAPPFTSPKEDNMNNEEIKILEDKIQKIIEELNNSKIENAISQLQDISLSLQMTLYARKVEGGQHDR